ncbi:Zinc transporter ZIP1 [Myotis davidii]|uniref:Zinc transporter ZIP1 n=1 Tax=Myotis davidii TaxID=225400 RepID=L5MHV7_MYODS|nr:Zinc transporter ZIP1 [Myotis davidii]
MDEALAALRVSLQFPLQELILAVGFFLVLMMEQITLVYKEQSVPPPREETRALLGTCSRGWQWDCSKTGSGHGAVSGFAAPSGKLALSLSLRLLQSHLRAKVVVGCGILFSCTTPLGTGLGAALAESAGPLHQLAQSVLEGMAAGTFIYITFLEILPQELATSQQRILKVILLL